MGLTFLLAEEIAELTGYRRKAEQRAWLARNGIPFIPNRFGQPVVARDVLLEKLGDARRGKNEPDWIALREVNHGSKASQR